MGCVFVGDVCGVSSNGVDARVLSMISKFDRLDEGRVSVTRGDVILFGNVAASVNVCFRVKRPSWSLFCS